MALLEGPFWEFAEFAAAILGMKEASILCLNRRK